MEHVFYTFLLQEVKDFEDRGEDVSLIKDLPDFFKLLSDMLDYEEVDKDSRLLINSALAYFISPDDVLPDDVYGVEGYIDDLFVCTFVLKKLYKYYSVLMKKLWISNAKLEETLENVYIQSKLYLEEKNLVERILRYSALN